MTPSYAEMRQMHLDAMEIDDPDERQAFIDSHLNGTYSSDEDESADSADSEDEDEDDGKDKPHGKPHTATSSSKSSSAKK